MDNYGFSAKNMGFYKLSDRERYGDVWPDDVAAISDAVYQEYCSPPPEGKILSADVCFPVWADAPLPSHEQLIAAAEGKKLALLDDARNTISIWQTELQLGIISDQDKASLINWLAYIKDVNQVDTKTAPDVAWPVAPSGN